MAYSCAGASRAYRTIGRFLAALRFQVALPVAIALLSSLLAVDNEAAAQSITSSSCGQSVLTATSGGCSGTLSNGDSFTITVETTGTFSIVATGPQPFTYNITSIGFSGTTLTFTGNETIGTGSPTAFSCTIDTATGSVSSGCGVLGTLFGGSAGTSVAAAGAAHGTTRAQVEGTVQVLSNRIQSISRDIAMSQGGSAENSRHSYSGLSAGSPDMKWGVWFDGSGSYLSNDSATAAYEGYGVTGLGGIDYLFQNSWLFGFDVGYARTDIRVNALMGNRIADTVQGGPYVSYIINSHFTADASAVYSRVFNTITTLAGSNSNYDSDRVTTALNLNGFTTTDFNLVLTGFVGWAYAYEAPSSNAPNAIGGQPTMIHYSALRTGGELAYDIGDFEPYIPLTISYETTETRDGTGRLGVDVGIGMRYHWTDRLKVGVQATTEQRSHGESAVGSFNLRYVF